jgi:hypothetical protein
VAGLQQPCFFAEAAAAASCLRSIGNLPILTGWKLAVRLKLTTMLNTQNQRRALIRRIAAVALLCLFVMRGMTFIGMALAMAATDAENSAFAHAVLGDHCARQDGSDGPSKNTRSEHCVLCCSAARDIVESNALIFVEVVLLTPDAPATLTPRDNEIPHLGKAPGLIANWSATSPPPTRGI